MLVNRIFDTLDGSLGIRAFQQRAGTTKPLGSVGVILNDSLKALGFHDGSW